MTLQSKRELIQAIRRVYRKASKRQKSQHLDHLELVTELKRNYLNRLLLASYKERRKRPSRQSRYARDPEFMTALKRIWVATRYLSGKLLKRSIRFYVETYQFHYGALPAEVSGKLLKISPATIAYSQKIGHLFAERSATPGHPVDNSVIRVCIPL
jgi:hypothetical protein